MYAVQRSDARIASFARIRIPGLALLHPRCQAITELTSLPAADRILRARERGLRTAGSNRPGRRFGRAKI